MNEFQSPEPEILPQEPVVNFSPQNFLRNSLKKKGEGGWIEGLGVEGVGDTKSNYSKQSV
jgi:hypothetical protein